MDTKPDAVLCLEHLAVEAIAPRFVRPRRIPKEQHDAEHEQQMPAGDWPQPTVCGESNADDRDRRHAEQHDAYNGVAHSPKLDNARIEIPKRRFGDDRHDGGGFGRIHKY